MDRKELDTLLGAFGEKLPIQGLAFDEKGYCCLLVDTVTLNMEVSAEGSMLFFYTSLGTVPDKGKEDFYRLLLEADFFWQNTGGSTLGINKEDDSVVMAYAFHTQALTVPALETIVENFVNTAQAWITLCTHANAPDEPEQGEETLLITQKV